ncbi:MAG: PQQ-binding-like beta-propeller repeat protein [Anaerolineae bacterium]|nr:PQQ-binding-like beta-propeller repeat protein [Anaerolineae bacterium]
MGSKYVTSARVLLVALLLVLLALPLTVLAQDDTWDASLGDIVYGTALSEDGTIQIVGSRNNRVAAYDQQGNLLWEFAPQGTVWGVDTSADGQYTAVASEDRNVYLLNAEGEQLWAYRDTRIFLDVAISADGSRIAAVDESRQLFYFDRETGEPMWTYGLENIADSIAIYGSSKIRPLAGTRDSVVSLFSPEGSRLWRAQLSDDVTGIAVTSNGAQVVAATLDGQITLINGANADIIWQITPPDQGRCTSRSNCLTVDMAADGSRVLVGSRSGEVFLLDSADGSVIQRSNFGEPISSLAISADGQTWLIGTRGGAVHATTTEAAAAAYAIAQTNRRNLMIGIPAALLLLLAIGAVWVNRTTSGAHFWNVTSRPVRRTLVSMWRSRVSYFLIIPTIILLLIFNYYPAASGLYHSFTEWNPGIETTWVGLDQFGAMVNSQYFWIGMKNAVLLAVAAFVKLAVPLLVAELIFHIRSNFMQYAVRTLFIIPLVVPSVVGVLLWVNIYDPNIGLLNETLRGLGLDQLTRTWLGDRSTAMPALIAIGFPWISPFALLIFYGGLITIPQELFDAAKVDGATWWNRFIRIDIPMIMSQIKLLLILAFIGSIQEFQLIFLTTGGGPGNVTYTPALELYYTATRFTNFGLASAMGTFLFLIILGGTIINLRYVRSQTEYEA